MSLDALLAIAHHLAAFSVLATLAAEWALVRPGLDGRDVGRLAAIDAAYGTAAATVVAVGIARVFLGPLDASFYLGNLLFWAKMAAFGAVGLASIAPTRRFQRWRVAAADERWAPPAAEVEASRRTLRLELALFGLIPVCAALMARGIGR